MKVFKNKYMYYPRYFPRKWFKNLRFHPQDLMLLANKVINISLDRLPKER